MNESSDHRRTEPPFACAFDGHASQPDWRRTRSAGRELRRQRWAPAGVAACPPRRPGRARSLAAVLPVGLHIDAQTAKHAAFLFESSWKKPYSTREYARCSPATPNKPASRTTCHPTAYATSSSPGSRRKASTTPSSSPTQGHASRKSLEIYSRIALTDAQASYDDTIGRFPV
jgi:hypothetical protein